MLNKSKNTTVWGWLAAVSIALATSPQVHDMLPDAAKTILSIVTAATVGLLGQKSADKTAVEDVHEKVVEVKRDVTRAQQDVNSIQKEEGR
jgi:hypothetical protein